MEVTETEDHIASLCEVMRYLIAGDDVGVSNLGAQQRFFNAHLRSLGRARSATPWKRIRAQTSIAPWPASAVISSRSRRRGFDLLDA